VHVPAVSRVPVPAVAAAAAAFVAAAVATVVDAGDVVDASKQLLLLLLLLLLVILVVVVIILLVILLVIFLVLPGGLLCLVSGRYHPPRQRMPFNSRNEGTRFVSMTWQEMSMADTARIIGRYFTQELRVQDATR